MGNSRVVSCADATAKQRLLRAVVEDLKALELLLQSGSLDETRRIGAEQEFMIVDQHLNPAPVADQILARLSDKRFTTELGRFNLEANLTPRLFRGDCLRELWAELEQLCALGKRACRDLGVDLVLAGIWPTMDLVHTDLRNLTPLQRFHEFNRLSLRRHGGNVPFSISGVDSLGVSCDTILLEAGPTSFQVHLQTPPDEFVSTFNACLLLAAPLVAISANSSILAGRRLWHETRIPLLERSADVRHPAQTRRAGRSRTSLGHGFLQHSVLEAFHADLAAFDAIVGLESPSASLLQVERGETPSLHALNTFNGTVWRWVRPCYGVTDGKPHLRIENRVISAGPTLIDELANTALFLGLATAVPRMFGDVQRQIDFQSVDNNLHAAARDGLDAELEWLSGRRITARELFDAQLLDLASYGLKVAGISDADARALIAVIAGRVETGRTGAAWMHAAHAALPPTLSRRARSFRIASAMKVFCWGDLAVHEWPASQLPEPLEKPAALVAMRTTHPSITPDAPLELAEQLLEADPAMQLLVEDEEGTFLGLLGLADVKAHRAPRSDCSATARDVVRTEVAVIDAAMSAEEAWSLLAARGEQLAVVKRGSAVVGVVRAEDLVALLSQRPPAPAPRAEAAEAPL